MVRLRASTSILSSSATGSASMTLTRAVQVRLFAGDLLDLDAGDALDDHADAVGDLRHHADDDGDADAVDVGGAGVFDGRVLHGDDADDAVAAGNGVVHELDAVFAAHGDGGDQHGEDDGVAQGQQAQLLGDRPCGSPSC